MTTITEDYVSFEVAKLLKEKGFDEKCQKVYMHNGQLLWAQVFMEGESFVNNKCINLVANYNGWITYTQGEYAYLCPTLQMAMKWLRETHNLHIMVNCIGKVNYDPIVQRFDGKDFEIEGVEVGTTRRINGKWEDIRRGFKTYEQACEAAIKYCLENLI